VKTILESCTENINVKRMKRALVRCWMNEVLGAGGDGVEDVTISPFPQLVDSMNKSLDTDISISGSLQGATKSVVESETSVGVVEGGSWGYTGFDKTFLRADMITLHKSVELAQAMKPMVRYIAITTMKERPDEFIITHKIQYPIPQPTSHRQLRVDMTLRRDDGAEYKDATSIIIGSDAVDMNPMRINAKYSNPYSLVTDDSKITAIPTQPMIESIT